MKILIISTYDIQGGAAIAATRLMQALQHTGCDVSMAVRSKKGTGKEVFKIGNDKGNTLRFYWERGVIYLYNRLSRSNLFDVSIANTGVQITELPQFKEADVIHLHWINQGMLSVKEIGQILASGKKVVWTMHDMWPFTGICHYAGTCNAYTNGCGRCPYLKAPSKNDLSRTVFHRKELAYAKGNITFTACSQWLAELAQLSPLTCGSETKQTDQAGVFGEYNSITLAHRVVSIPNPIDTNIYAPGVKDAIREKMNLPKDNKIVLFAAMKASDPRKGMDYLIKAAQWIAKERNDLLFLIAGANGGEIAAQFPLPSHCAGFVASEKMPDLYNAADLFVTPSLQDNLPNTIMEAMACGTPCVGFGIGGIPEMIDHHKNGYVAEYKNAQDLAKGMLWTLFEANSETLSANARSKVMETYKQEIVARQYGEVYSKMGLM